LKNILKYITKNINNMNAIAKFFGFGGGNNVLERSVVP